jgi:hypothetical protein
MTRCYFKKISNEKNTSKINASEEHISEEHISEVNALEEHISEEHISEEHISEEHISEANALEEHISEVNALEKHISEVNALEVNALEEHEPSHKIKYNQECEFRGLIAGIGNIFTKYKKYQMVITVGYDNNKFVNLHLNKKRDLSRFKQIIGKGYWIESKTPHIVVTKMTLL